MLGLLLTSLLTFVCLIGIYWFPVFTTNSLIALTLVISLYFLWVLHRSSNLLEEWAASLFPLLPSLSPMKLHLLLVLLPIIASLFKIMMDSDTNFIYGILGILFTYEALSTIYKQKGKLPSPTKEISKRRGDAPEIEKLETELSKEPKKKTIIRYQGLLYIKHSFESFWIPLCGCIQDYSLVLYHSENVDTSSSWGEINLSTYSIISPITISQLIESHIVPDIPGNQSFLQSGEFFSLSSNITGKDAYYLKTNGRAEEWIGRLRSIIAQNKPMAVNHALVSHLREEAEENINVLLTDIRLDISAACVREITTKSGWLSKRGKQTTARRKKRLFMIHPSLRALYYFVKGTSNRAKGFILLHGNCKVNRVDTLSFTVFDSYKLRTFHLTSISDIEAEEWVAALEKIIHNK